MKYAVLFWLIVAGSHVHAVDASSINASSIDVSFINASRPTACAEEDNVYVKVQQAGVTAFRLRAVHPPYIGTVVQDSTAPDFSQCDMSHDPTFAFTPRTVTLYEDAKIRLVGHAYSSFWRPDVVDFRVGARSEPGLHLVQLISRRQQGEVEMLVIYPADGYWRAKPLPPTALPDTAYGSSFLFGPIEEDGRPYVAIRRIEFDPATLTFRLDFRDASHGSLRVVSATPEGLDLAVTLDPSAANRPFAAMRSMFVTPDFADVARVDWPAKNSAPILSFEPFRAARAQFGRTQPSRHNLSAPDLVFDHFKTVDNFKTIDRSTQHDHTTPTAAPGTPNTQ